ncbi:hypothetical protein NIES2111_58850 (plasmid) [Nostoc sp. NIES-2111]|nr:hypothetical protein NIES2111_58850 [Nostoc sp. NIES-2111]
MPQDFSGQNLRGRSFKSQDLAGANFSYADIRGTDFTGANLKGANFSYARAGLQPHQQTKLLLIVFILSAVSGIISGIIGYATLRIEDWTVQSFIADLISLITLIFFFEITINQGFVLGLGAVAAIFIGGFLLLGLGTASVTIGVLASTASILNQTANIANNVIIVVSFIIAEVVILIVTIAFASAIDKKKINNLLVNGTAIVTAIFVAVNATLATEPTTRIFSAIAAIIFSTTAVLFSKYINRCALAGNEKNVWIISFAIAFASTGSTSFRSANFTNANFTKATLKNTDFRDAILNCTEWYGSKCLDTARPGKTYLKNIQLRKLLVTRDGQNLNFDGQNLQEINLQGANLKYASFIGANLSGTNLQDADLFQARLVQTQLDRTDFTGACLTGAFIEDWNITSNTKFDNVKCEYVYMQLPTAEKTNYRRKPDNIQEVFEDGDFGNFIKPLVDTLDLYHNRGVDPRAIAISFKQLAEKHPDAKLEIVAMEKRGEDKFLLRAKTSPEADKSELSAEYFSNYNQFKGLTEREIKLLLSEKENQIRRLENMVMTALERPSFYAQTYQNQGDTIMSKSSKQVFNNNLQGAQFAGGLVNADTVNANQIGGNITNYNPEQKQNLAQAAADIQQLLNQLSQTYPTTTTSEKMTVVAKAVDEIESNPTLKARVISALKAGGTEALKELIGNPLINILLASIDGWQEAE